MNLFNLYYQSHRNYEFYFNIRYNKELLKILGITDYIVVVNFGYYRFMKLLENMVNIFPDKNIEICNKLLNGTWYEMGMDCLIQLSGKVFIDYPDSKNRILEKFTEKFIHSQNSFFTDDVVIKAPDLFKACLEPISSHSKDTTLPLILNLFDICLEKIKDENDLVNRMLKFQSEVKEKYPGIQSFAEIRKCARILGQDKSLSFLANCSDEVLMKIASQAKNPEVHTEDEADKIAYDHLYL